MNISVLKAALINVYKGKALPEGHISTRSDGSQWKKSGKKWKLHKAAPKAKKPKAETKKKPEEKKPAIRSKMAPPKNMDDMVKWAKDQGKDFQNVENLAREYNKAKVGTKTEKQQQESDSLFQKQNEYDRKLKEAKLPKGKKETITLKQKDGSPREATGTSYGDYFIEKRGGAYDVTHKPSGLKINPESFPKGMAEDYVKAYLNSGINMNFKTREEIPSEDFDKMLKIAKHFTGGAKEVPDFVPSTSEQVKKAVKEKKTPKEKDSSPKPEPDKKAFKEAFVNLISSNKDITPSGETNKNPKLNSSLFDKIYPSLDDRIYRNEEEIKKKTKIRIDIFKNSYPIENNETAWWERGENSEFNVVIGGNNIPSTEAFLIFHYNGEISTKKLRPMRSAYGHPGNHEFLNEYRSYTDFMTGFGDGKKVKALNYNTFEKEYEKLISSVEKDSNDDNFFEILDEFHQIYRKTSKKYVKKYLELIKDPSFKYLILDTHTDYFKKKQEERNKELEKKIDTENGKSLSVGGSDEVPDFIPSASEQVKKAVKEKKKKAPKVKDALAEVAGKGKKKKDTPDWSRTEIKG